ncbi:phosphoribosyltransferase [Limnoraphis robusta]|uniref:Phosphoribosyltransferase family protein n=1 Tax=Limnoraphis robusta CCNP1315 TaxID=3110306 RepID=A0ABU5TVM8_9CYAN|nr:phosphoribosyltransferase family protein [Limnoraphis robusta]MEA5518939.1 phosphoribosyltransferase family protein [Limnoraphis robusta CCNP1315]MEA5548423.1 phosphoribosyltransferase family protein [Limnoraphis robusta CCNP1324]
MFSTPPFDDRTQAGQELAEAIEQQIRLYPPKQSDRLIVYALPRGGLPVAEPVARRLNCALDVIVAKKITHPDNPELALGAVTAEGYVLWSPKRRPPNLDLQQTLLHQAHGKALDQFAQFSPYCPEISPENALTIIVDDGIATGLTIAVAVKSLKYKNPSEIWIGVPVAPYDLLETLQRCCDRLIVLKSPRLFFSVSRFYQEFSQVETEMAIAHLKRQTEWL